MRNLHRLLLASLVAGSLGGAAGCYGTTTYGGSGSYGYLSVDTAPPQPLDVYYDNRPGYVYVQGHWGWENNRWNWHQGYYAPQRDGYAYRQGYWDYVDGHYLWRNGGWEAQRPGYVYQQGYWDNAGGRYRWQPGGWQQQRPGQVWVDGHWLDQGGNRRVWVNGGWQARTRVRDHRDDGGYYRR